MHQEMQKKETGTIATNQAIESIHKESFPSSKTYFENEMIRLSDIATGEKQLTIDGKTFDNCTLLGPATVRVMKGFAIQKCSFVIKEGDNLLVELKQKQRVAGTIGLKNCVFRNCRFRNIGIIGVPSELDHLKEILAKGGTTW